MVDEHGVVCPAAGNLVRFRLSGSATIAGVDNGDPINHEPFKADKHKVFHGLGLVVVGAGRTPGKIKLRAEADGLESMRFRWRPPSRPNCHGKIACCRDGQRSCGNSRSGAIQ